jgi:ribosomal protein S3
MLKFLFDVFVSFKGYKISFKGKINKAARARKRVHQYGRIPLTTLNESIIYSEQEVFTPGGMCTLKVWLFFNTTEKPGF